MHNKEQKMMVHRLLEVAWTRGARAMRNWSFRYASAAMPRVANGLRLDRRLFRNRGDVFEGEYRTPSESTPAQSECGQRWRRPHDTVATELTVSGISGVHALYVASGGHNFLIGDGRLQYGPEYISETYYSARLFPGFLAGFDLQHVSNPAYNQQRGPVWITSIRLHVELGKNTFAHRDKH